METKRARENRCLGTEAARIQKHRGDALSCSRLHENVDITVQISDDSIQTPQDQSNEKRVDDTVEACRQNQAVTLSTVHSADTSDSRSDQDGQSA